MVFIYIILYSLSIRIYIYIYIINIYIWVCLNRSCEQCNHNPVVFRLISVGDYNAKKKWVFE